MRINSKKEGKYLVFELDEGRSGVVKYDLATKQYIGKKGKPVANLCSQFRGYSIEGVINSFQDEAYRKFLTKVYHSSSCSSNYSNVGTFLTKVADYSNLEQFFSAGITKVDISRRIKISDVPKGVLKMCKENPTTMPLKDNLIDNYKQRPDFCNIVYSMKDEMIEFKCVLLLYEKVNKGYYYSINSLTKVIELMEDYNYNLKSLLKYIDNIMTFEGISTYSEVLNNLYDYAVMAKKISDKYEKYPKYLKTIHDITVRNYNRLKETFNEIEFSKKIDKDMEFKYKEYVFLYPNTTQDIKDEAINQSNCVASYIQRVLDGRCHIMFMRLKGSQEDSLITLEISTDTFRVVQQKGRFNRDTTKEENEVIDKFNEHLNKLKKERVGK